jgi:hypothetical protein
MTMKNLRLTGIVLVIAVLLLIPLIAGFPWTRLDYITAGILLLGTGLSCELVMRNVKRLEYKIVLCGAILGALVLIWAAIVSSE